MLFRSYSTSNFDRVIALFKEFSDLTLFPDNAYYSFHPIVLKRGEQLDYEMTRRILFRGYSIPNFDRVIAL